MHIPDGFLDLKTSVAAGALALGGIGWAVREANRRLPPARRPMLGLAAAFVFAAQMINFPIWGGTSGHLMGSVLAAVLLGPGAAVVAMTAVLAVQCLLFNDGGLLSLGANLFNMALVAPLAGYAVYAGLTGLVSGMRGRLMAAVFASWCATVLAAFCCASELAFSGTARWAVVLPAMVHVHMVIGVGEGLITGLVLLAILRTRPELVRPLASSAVPAAGWYYPALLICAGIALFLSPHASSLPDGLEKVAERLGFAHRAGEAPGVASPMPDYQFPGLGTSPWATGLAGLVGTVAALGLSWLFARWAARRVGSSVPPETGRGEAGAS